jgi:osmotically-inducible protein OsmY
MVLRFQISGHEDSCGAGHGVAATRASVESALRSACDIDADEIVVEMLGAYVILEGFVRQRGDVERAVEIAEDVVGTGYVRSRMLRR